MLRIRLALLCLFVAPLLFSQGTISTIAGGARITYPPSGSPATGFPLGNILMLASDAAGNVYASDTSNEAVYKITPSGAISTVWEGGSGCPYSVVSVAELFCGVVGGSIAADPAGNVYIFYEIDTGLIGVFDFLVKISPSGTSSSVPVQLGCCSTPTGFTTDAANNFYFINNSGRVVQVAPGGTQTVLAAALGTYGNAFVNGMARDNAGNFYFSQGGQVPNTNTQVAGRILKATTSGAISVIAGNGVNGFSGDGGPAAQASLNNPTQLAFDAAGNLYVADTGNNRIRAISPAGIITTFAGTSTAGLSGDGGPASGAQFSSPQGLAVDASGNVYVGDSNNWRIRKINTSGVISEFAGNGLWAVSGDGGPALQATVWFPLGVLEDSNGNIFTTEAIGRIRKISSSGQISIFGGSTPGFSGDGGPATQAQFGGNLWGIAMDSAGNLYVADARNNRVRRIDTKGMVTTVAGGGSGTGCDNCPATSAVIAAPTGVAVDSNGSLYITDRTNFSVRKVDASGNITTYVSFTGTPQIPGGRGPVAVAIDGTNNLYVSWGGSGPSAYAGIARVTPGGAVTLLAQGLNATTLAADASGTVYAWDATLGEIFRVNADGSVVHVAGSNAYGFSGDGGPALSAELAGPSGLFVDSNGFLLIADTGNLRIRRVVGPSCTGAAEPVVTLPLNAGFYIAEVQNPSGSRNGYWGLQAIVPLGNIAGGFNVGGAILGNDNFPGYTAFSIPVAQNVTVSVAAQALAGGAPSIYARLLDANRQLVGAEVSGSGSLTVTNSLPAGFYILEVHTAANSPAVAFQASVITPSVDGGVNAGGYVEQGTLGYGAFFVPQSQNVTLQLTGPTNGGAGAGCLALTLLDINRNVIRTAP